VQLDVRLVVSQTAGLAALTAVLVSGCGMSEDVVSSMSLRTSESNPVGTQARGIVQVPEGTPGEDDSLRITPRQREYLDTLSGSGVKPSTELLALTIGSYVCQALAANQSDQAVWDLVLPMVRGDVRDAETGGPTPPVGQVNSATADYIRIATERLC
jgi:Protein of unknown function (DUF732)